MVTGSSVSLVDRPAVPKAPQRSPVVVTGSSSAIVPQLKPKIRASTEPGRGDREQANHPRMAKKWEEGLNGARSW